MRHLLTILATLLMAGCWSPTKLHDTPGGVSLSVAGAPSVDDSGYTVTLWFDIPEPGETIQRITATNHPGFEGVESHRQPMWVPDYQSFRRVGDGPRYVRRVNTVSPGRTTGAPWHTAPSLLKGVVMIDGFLEDGEPVFNRTYFAWGGRQGGTVTEEHIELGVTYTLEWWSRRHPENPRPGQATVRISVGDVVRSWSE